jgi:hypothetical protein
MTQLNKRHFPLENAKNDMAKFMTELTEKYELTATESFAVLSDRLSQLTSSCVAAERQEND